MKEWNCLLAKKLLAHCFTLIFCIVPYTLSEDTTAEDRIRIGVIQSLSGIAAEDGQTITNALLLAQEDINKNNERKIELIIEDDKTNPKATVAAYQKLKAQNIKFIIGPTWDFTTNSVLPLAGNDRIIVFNTCAPLESLNLNLSKGYGFTNHMSNKAYALPFLEFAKDHQIKSVVIIHANNAWGETQMQAYRSLTKENKIKIAEVFTSVSYDENEWRSQLPRIKATEADGIILILNKNDIEVFLKRAQEISLESKIFVSKNAYDAYRLSKNKELYAGLCYTYPKNQLNSNKDFIDNYQESFSQQPRICSDNSYDSLHMAYQAFQIAKAEKIKLKESLQRVDYSGLAGNYRYKQQSSFSIGISDLVCIS